MCWVEAGEGLSKLDHQLYDAPFDVRRARRAELKTETEQSQQLLAFERARRADESGSEPEYTNMM